MKRYAGMDVHSKKIVWAVVDGEGRLLGEGQVATSEAGLRELVERAGLQPGDPVAIETGTQANWVSARLAHLKLDPRVYSAEEVRAKTPRKGRKTDRRDALELADGERRGLFEIRVWTPSKTIERSRQAISRRRHMVAIRTRQINAAKFVLRTRGLAAAGTLTTQTAWEALLGRADLDEPAREDLTMHFEIWRQAECQVRRCDKIIKAAAEPFAETIELLKTVPGVGDLVASAFVAALGDPNRFATSAKVVGYLGLAPRMHDSGETVRRGHITKQGPAYLRALQCQAAHHVAKPDHPLNPYWRRTVAGKGVKRTVIIVARRLAKILWRMWRDGKPFDVSKLNVTCVNRTVTRKVKFELKKAGVRTKGAQAAAGAKTPRATSLKSIKAVRGGSATAQAATICLPRRP